MARPSESYTSPPGATRRGKDEAKFGRSEAKLERHARPAGVMVMMMVAAMRRRPEMARRRRDERRRREAARLRPAVIPVRMDAMPGRHDHDVRATVMAIVVASSMRRRLLRRDGRPGSKEERSGGEERADGLQDGADGLRQGGPPWLSPIRWRAGRPAARDICGAQVAAEKVSLISCTSTRMSNGFTTRGSLR